MRYGRAITWFAAVHVCVVHAQGDWSRADMLKCPAHHSLQVLHPGHLLPQTINLAFLRVPSYSAGAQLALRASTLGWHVLGL